MKNMDSSFLKTQNPYERNDKLKETMESPSMTKFSKIVPTIMVVTLVIVLFAIFKFTPTMPKEAQPVFMIFFGIIIGVAIITIIVIFFISNNRKKKLISVAKELGFLFDEKGNQNMLKNLNQFLLFNNGERNGKISNMMSGKKANHNWLLFDYRRYTSGGGGYRHRGGGFDRYTVALTSISKSFPSFKLALTHKSAVQSMLNVKGIEISNYPEFSNKYILEGDENIKQFFSPEIVDFFLKNEILGSLEVVGNSLIYYTSKWKCKPQKIAGFLEEASKVANFLG